MTPKVSKKCARSKGKRNSETHIVESTVRTLASDFVELLVRVKGRRFEGTEKIFRVDDESLSSDLTETERGEETSLDTIGLNRLGRVEEVFEGTKLLRDVVGVTIEDARGQRRRSQKREEMLVTYRLPGMRPD